MPRSSRHTSCSTATIHHRPRLSPSHHYPRPSPSHHHPCPSPSHHHQNRSYRQNQKIGGPTGLSSQNGRNSPVVRGASRPFHRLGTFVPAPHPSTQPGRRGRPAQSATREPRGGHCMRRSCTPLHPRGKGATKREATLEPRGGHYLLPLRTRSSPFPTPRAESTNEGTPAHPRAHSTPPTCQRAPR